MLYAKIIQRFKGDNAADKRRRINVALTTLLNRLQRWTNDKPTLIQLLVSAGKGCIKLRFCKIYIINTTFSSSRATLIDTFVFGSALQS